MVGTRNRVKHRSQGLDLTTRQIPSPRLIYFTPEITSAIAPLKLEIAPEYLLIIQYNKNRIYTFSVSLIFTSEIKKKKKERKYKEINFCSSYLSSSKGETNIERRRFRDTLDVA